MNALVEGKWFAPGGDLSVVLPLRQAVLGRGRDALDDLAWNVVVWQEGEAAACGRIWWQEGAFYLGDIAVPEDKRRRKLGDLVLRLLLFKAESHSARLIRALSPVAVAPFFTRLGFQMDGPAANGIQPLLLRGEDLCLDTCASCRKDCPNRK